MKLDDSKLKTNIFKVDGVDLYFIDDILFVDNSNYSHFFKLDDAFNYYKKLQEIVKKKVIFVFKDYEFTVDENTTIEDINKQLVFQTNVLENNNKNIKKDSILRKKLLYEVDFSIKRK